jgi:hypothetical protein
VVGYLDVHAGSTEMEEWEAALGVRDQAGHRKSPSVPALTGLCSRFDAWMCRCNKRVRVGNRS